MIRLRMTMLAVVAALALVVGHNQLRAQATDSCAAGPTRQSGFQTRVPNGAKFDCETCHVNGDESSPPRFAGFRRDFFNARSSWTTALAQLDSDGDGFTNGQELGDPTGAWRRGQANPGVLANVSNPSDPNSIPPVTATPTPPPATPTPTPTEPAVDTATPTPTQAADTPTPTNTPSANPPSIELGSTKLSYAPGEDVTWTFTITNPAGQPAFRAQTYIVLELGGQFYWLPTGGLDAVPFETSRNCDAGPWSSGPVAFLGTIPSPDLGGLALNWYGAFLNLDSGAFSNVSGVTTTH